MVYWQAVPDIVTIFTDEITHPKSYLGIGVRRNEKSRQAKAEMARPGAKTINVFRACLGAQLTICAQK